MNNPRLECVYFGGKEYTKLARVLELSAKLHIPQWEINVTNVAEHNLSPALNLLRNKFSNFFGNNAHKSLEWCRIIRESKDGDRVLLIDADTYIRSNLDEIWDRDFDVMLTSRDFKWPFNSGVIFVNVNKSSRIFFNLIELETNKMLNDGSYHAKFVEKYGGIHQAAIGAVIDNNDLIDINLQYVPCKIWNGSYYKDDPAPIDILNDAKIIHLVSNGRQAVRRAKINSLQDKRWTQYIKEWRELHDKIIYKYKYEEIIDRLNILRDHFNRKLDILEIGVWRGGLVERLLPLSFLNSYHLLDPWKAGIPGTRWFNSGSSMLRYNQTEFDNAYIMVKKMIKDHPHIHIHKGSSDSKVNTFADQSLDFVFIDGDHSYQGVKEDIRNYLPKIRKGGYIGGHDYDSPQFPGVKAAVLENFDRSIVEIGDSETWFVRVN